MEFALMVDLGRVDADTSYRKNLSEVTELVRMAEEGGFDMVVCGEHHGHEMTIAPNPFQLLAYWATSTQRVRLGTAVVCAPYWHPVRLAGEAGLLDLLSEGRFELGIGRGAYPFEFARMADGIGPEEARQALDEMLPALRGLWAGEYEHDGERWSFPSTTATPRPSLPGGPRVWVSARHPDVFRMAIQNRCDLMVNPLDAPFSEVEELMEKRRASVADVDNGYQPQMMVLRHTYVQGDDEDDYLALRFNGEYRKRFQNLLDTDGEVIDGFVQPVKGATEVSDEELVRLRTNLTFGRVDEVVDKLKRYKNAGTDVYLYGTGTGIPHEYQRASLRRFIDDVIPAVQGGRNEVQAP